MEEEVPPVLDTSFDWEAEREMDDAADHLLVELFSSSDKEEEEVPKWGGSYQGRSKNKERDHAGAYATVIRHYFSGPDSKYDEKDFQRRFRVPRAIFNRIHDKFIGQWPFIGPVTDAVGKPGIYPLTRLVACFRQLAYGDAYDRQDEYLQMSESSVQVTLKAFCQLMNQHFPEYLNRCPTEGEKLAAVRSNTERGFPGMFASWDCKHFVWHRCPMRWQGQYKGHAEGGKMTLILEAIADRNRYIWYANFGDAGSQNDINVLNKSSIVGSMQDASLNTTIPPYTINGTVRDWMYFLADGIYPDWAVFVKTYSEPYCEKHRLFAKRQEAVRKDVECAFGILVAKFHVLARPIRQWYIEEIVDLLHCCVILHNMVVAHYGEDYLQQEEATVADEAMKEADRSWPLFGGAVVDEEIILADGVDLFAARVAAYTGSMANAYQHFKLKHDLTEHVYHRYYAASVDNYTAGVDNYFEA